MTLPVHVSEFRISRPPPPLLSFLCDDCVVGAKKRKTKETPVVTAATAADTSAVKPQIQVLDGAADADDDDDEAETCRRNKVCDVIRRTGHYAPHRAAALSVDARLTSVCRVHRA